ncbi:MAG TPA: hypothetical protein VF593_10940 [Chthoniobacteraceae bacterium]|jgi:hypothetical protein
MKARFKIAALILAGITALALIFLAAQRVIAVARVQNSVSRGWEIKFESQGRPAALPTWADDATGSFFDWAFGHTKGTSNLQIIHRERFQALFRGPITEIGIYEPHELKADALAFALRQFPSLRRLAIETGISTPIAADWKVLSASLRALPRLEELTLWSGDITDTDLAPLAGHPNLRSVVVEGGPLTSACAQTFATFPRLSKLTISAIIYENGWLTAAERTRFAELLPGVALTLDPPLQNPAAATIEDLDSSPASASAPPDSP